MAKKRTKEASERIETRNAKVPPPSNSPVTLIMMPSACARAIMLLPSDIPKRSVYIRPSNELASVSDAVAHSISRILGLQNPT